MLRKRQARCTVLGLLLSTMAASSPAQSPRQTGQQAQQQIYEIDKTRDSSDLAQENLNRVAASAAQIRAVLARDAGLMVELKRWVAKEATDNGQIIEDSNLTDAAIFERLEQDIPFRSVVTRLLQRYGYLVPASNPESDAGKEKELVLKERARRFVQIEAQEDAEAYRQAAASKQAEQAAACDSNSDEGCEQKTPGQGHPKRASPTLPNDAVTPEQLPQQNLQHLLQAQGIPLSPGLSEGGLGAGLDLSSSPFKQASLSLDNLGPSGPAPMGQPLPVFPNLGGLSVLVPPVEESNPAASLSAKATKEHATSSRAFQPGSPKEEEFAPVRMVHRANPYSDIPSLYDMYVQAAMQQKAVDRFGLDVFRNSANDPDAIPMDLPVGPDYEIGPGDGLEIDLWGAVSQRIFRTVDREGRVSLPEAGPLLVSGRNLGEVQQAVQRVLRTQFRDISADVSLSRLRTVRVYVVGDVAQAGAYDISSLSTPLNALFAAGGVTSRGALRTVKHMRGNQLVEEMDAYDLLLHGVRSNLHPFVNGDTLLVPPIGPQVTVDGMVRRPAIYELADENSLADVLELAGGILPTATLSHIEVQRVVAHEKRTMLSLQISADDKDEVKKQIQSFQILDGDQVHIFPIAPYNEDAIYMQGHVLRPGRYSYREGMKVSDLIGSYKDLLPEPAPHYAEIVRLNAPDSHQSVVSFDLSAALADPASAPKLQPLDTVRVFSRFDFEPAPEVWIGGEVRSPGKYRTSGESRVKDAVFLAGGVTPDASLDSAQLFRTQRDGTLKIFSVNLREALTGNPEANLLLEPRDRLMIHMNPARVEPPTVYVKGEVAKPGRYPLTINMHVEDLIHVAGGLKRSADSAAADLTRYELDDGKPSSAKSVSVNISGAMNGEENSDVPLRDGDVLSVRQKPGWNDIAAMVTVKGEVQHPGTFGIRPGERLSSALARAGGFNAQAYPYGAVLMRREVRELELKSRAELLQRIKAEQVSLRALPEGDADQRNAKLTAISEAETTLEELQTNPPVGRVVIHIKPDIEEWRNSASDIALRDGDVLFVPKKIGYVMVNGQVFNPTAVGYQSGRSARWYLSQAGGVTPMADRKSVFVIRADGSVIAAKNNSSEWWSGDPLSAALQPGDLVVVPERVPKIGSRNWTPLIQAGQMASSLALAVAYLHP